MKVCIVTPSLGLGGAERSAAMQSIMLTELGYEVHIVLISNIIFYEYKGEIFNLGKLKDKNNSLFYKIKRIILFKKYLKANRFDAIIDNRLRNSGLLNELGVCKYVYRKLKIFYVIHSSSYKNEVQKNLGLKKWLLKDAFKIVVVNKTLLDLIKPFHKKNEMVSIENTVDFDAISFQSKEPINILFPYILYCGRLDEGSKNISLLIEAYAISDIYKGGTKLIILGDGPDENYYKQLVFSLNIQDFVIFESFKSNPFVYMKYALCTVLTSFYEGFPLVLIESLALGTPVVAINCETGPSEIIQHNVNGILLETYDVNELSKAFKSITNDEELLNKLRKNTLQSVRKFSKETIAEKWKSALDY